MSAEDYDEDYDAIYEEDIDLGEEGVDLEADEEGDEEGVEEGTEEGIEEGEIDEEGEEEYELTVIKNINENDNNHKIIRIVNPEDRITSEILSDFEMTEATGIRISQIENGSPVFTDVTGYNNVIAMAWKEFLDRQNPLKLWREIGQTATEILVEEWKIREMTFPMTDREILQLTQKSINETLNIKALKKAK